MDLQNIWYNAIPTQWNIFISPFICLQCRYDAIIPLVQISGHYFCFGGGGGRALVVGVGWETEGAFGVGLARTSEVCCVCVGGDNKSIFIIISIWTQWWWKYNVDETNEVVVVFKTRFMWCLLRFIWCWLSGVVVGE